MLAAYEADIAEIQAGDAYGNNIVDLYNPLNYIGAEGTENPAWMRIVCGAVEGDIAMFNSQRSVICTGLGAWEIPDYVRDIDRILKSKGIHTWVDYWGYDTAHDWPWWYKQVSYFVPELLN